MHRTQLQQNVIESAKHRIDLQKHALDLTAAALGGTFVSAVELISQSKTVITTGLGKSGFIARKMAASLSSLRQPAVYLHPVDALHGDSGLMSETDCVVAFSKSGETPEVVRFVEHAKAFGLPIVAICSRDESTLVSLATVSVMAYIYKELDDANILPTASTTTALVLADLLTIATATHVGIGSDALRQSHPVGGIGSSLLRTVEDVMHSDAHRPSVQETASLAQALAELTAKGLGAVCILDRDEKLLGLLTDGDVRRLVTAGRDLQNMMVADVMTREPIFIEPGCTLHEALLLMENPSKQISVLPVVRDHRCIGLVRLHDVLRMNY